MMQKNLVNIQVILIIFLILSLMYIELPGVYMDAINPGYMALYMKNPTNVPIWCYSDNIVSKIIFHLCNHADINMPIFNSLYGTCIPAYIMFF